jgi:hypothetical protein
MLRTTISFALHTIKVFYFFFNFTHTYKSCTEIVKNSLKIVCTANYGRSGKIGKTQIFASALVKMAEKL